MAIPNSVRDETLLWFTRALLAAVVWVTLWGVSFPVAGADRSISRMRVYAKRIDSLAELSDGALRALGTYVDVFGSATHRGSDSVLVVRGSDTLPVQYWLEVGVTPRIPPGRIDRLSVAAAKDSIRLVALELLALSAADREIARAGQIALGRERQFWTLLKAALGTVPGSTQRARAVDQIQRVQADMEIARVAVDTFIAYAQVAQAAREKGLRAAADSVRQNAKAFHQGLLLAALAGGFGIVLIQVLAVYALTGKWESLPQFIRRRIEPQHGTTAGDPG